MDRRNRVEWVILALSAIAVTGIVGFLVFDALRNSGSPPMPIVQLHPERAYRIPTGWMLPATATNNGDQSAQSVNLLASAIVGGEAEEAEVTVDYLPAGSEVKVTFGFSAEPEGEIGVRVSGFIR